MGQREECTFTRSRNKLRPRPAKVIIENRKINKLFSRSQKYLTLDRIGGQGGLAPLCGDLNVKWWRWCCCCFFPFKEFDRGHVKASLVFKSGTSSVCFAILHCFNTLDYLYSAIVAACICG